MYVANISKFSDTYTVNRKKVVTTCGYPTLYPPQPIIIHPQPIIAYNSPSSKKTAYTLRASCDIITALSPAVSVRRRLFPSVTLSKPCAMARRTSSMEKSPSGPIRTVISAAPEGCSFCASSPFCKKIPGCNALVIAVKKSVRGISG